MNRIIPVALVLLFGTMNDAHAYFDPGTGSIILQAVIAAVAAASIGLRAFWSQLKTFFYRTKTSRKDGSGTESDKKDPKD